MLHTIIIMAGGNSRRFSSNKLMADLHGKYLAEYALEMALQAKQNYPDPDQVQIVCVSQYPEIAQIIREKYPDIQPVISSSCKNGASFSIKEALKAAKGDYLTFVPADQPFINPDTFGRYLLEVSHSPKRLAGYSWNGEVCSPVTFYKTYIPELLMLEGDQGGKKVLKKHLDDVYYFLVSNKDELLDVDTKAELEEFRTI